MQNNFHQQNILIGVSGGIAAYKTAILVRELKKLGANIKVVMTKNATRFVTPLTFQALSGDVVYTSLWDEATNHGMTHIELARWADVFLIAPATANLIAKLAAGLADDLVTTLALLIDKPFIVCPAMNHSMWTNPATQENIATLKARQIFIVEPEDGEAACGESGIGRLCDVPHLLQALRLYKIYGILRGKACIITAGHTRERIDPVRYIANDSSGKMGYALAYAAWVAGANVILISGPTSLTAPPAINLILVESAQEMLEAVKKNLIKDCIFISAAAVADYASAETALHKIKKTTKLTLNLIQNPDILMQVTQSRLPIFVAGFAAETQALMQNAQKKLQDKHCDLIIANKVGPKLGFNEDDNQVTLLFKNEMINLPKMHKTYLAGEIMQFIGSNLPQSLS